jgi:hypothetical protein
VNHQGTKSTKKVQRFAQLFWPILLIGTQAVAQEETAYSPLIGAEIHPDASQASDLPALIATIAKDEHLQVASGNFDRAGQPVINMTLRLDGQTFLHFGNFRNPSAFELVMYSHESKSVWAPIWDRMVVRLKASVGPAEIELRQYDKQGHPIVSKPQ